VSLQSGGEQQAIRDRFIVVTKPIRPAVPMMPRTTPDRLLSP
jgi:hypothetical protein